MRAYKYLGLICTLFAVMGCSDFLEEHSQSEVIPSTAADYGLMFYQVLQSTPEGTIREMDDDVAIDESQFNGTEENWSAMNLRKSFTWQPDIWEGAEGRWCQYESGYTSISTMNAILGEIDDATGSVQEKELVKARALATRAYFYFILVNMFGEPYHVNPEAPGLVIKLEAVYTDEPMSRNTVGEVYERVVKDLEEASTLFQKYPKQGNDYLVNGTATDILLSRVYLYMEEYDKAITTADRAIESSEGLCDYTALPAGFYYMTTYDNPEVEWLFASIFFEQLFRPSDDLLSKFQLGDRRRDFLVDDGSSGWYSPGIKKVDAESGMTPNNMIRTAEAYLNRMEAKVLSETPDLTGALADLNELRRHRITGYSDVSITDAETLLQEIRDERRVELCFEGHRWFDLRRYGMPAITHEFRVSLVAPLLRYTLQEGDPMYTLPLPQSALKNNSKLGQNPSADGAERTGVPVV